MYIIYGLDASFLSQVLIYLPVSSLINSYKELELEIYSF